MPDNGKHYFNENIENIVTKQVIDNEWDQNERSLDNLDFQSLIDMLELKRNEKDYDWMSDIMPPILVSFMNTDASMWSNQYFQTRDFCEVKLDGTGPMHEEICRAAKKVLNSTLNRRKLYFYQKYIRARLINALRGHVYLVCWWEKRIEQVNTGQVKQIPETLDIDVEGKALPENWQDMGIQPAVRLREEPITEKRIVYDHFNCDVVDPRNIRTDNSYCYSAQDKPWITIRRSTTIQKLKKLGKKNGYFNLDIVAEMCKNPQQTDSSRETVDAGEPTQSNTSHSITSELDVFIRFGVMWVKITKTDSDGYPEEIKPGYDELGEPLKDAELIETISETAYVGSNKVLIRFQHCPFEDPLGDIYRPIIRGLCYIHPTKDTGLSSGKNLKEIQTATADNFNMGMDRVKMATLPTLAAGGSFQDEDYDDIRFEPGYVIPVKGNPKDELMEFKISDNVQGMNEANGTIAGWAQQAEAIFPTTMGDLPGKASTTATAVAGGESRTNLRGNYKSLTIENTLLQELYAIILYMTYQFAEQETLEKMCGKEDAQYFDPKQDYSYSPVSSNIEQEYNKNKKIQNYDQNVGRLSGLVQSIPELVPIIAHMEQRILELQGDEFQDVGKMIEALAKAKVRNKEGEEIGGGGSSPQVADQPETPTSNQTGNPMSMQESQVRMNGPGGGMG